jgi:hypothetical protein
MASVLKVDTIKSLAGNEAMTISESGVPLLNVPAFSVSTTTTATLTHTTMTKVPYNTVAFDTNNWFDTVNNRYIPQIAGYYQFTAVASVTGTTTTLFLFAFYLNGVSLGNALASRAATSTSQTFSITSPLIYLNGSTDYIEGYSRIDGASSLRFTTPNNLSGFLVRGA